MVETGKFILGNNYSLMHLRLMNYLLKCDYKVAWIVVATWQDTALYASTKFIQQHEYNSIASLL